MQTQLRHLSVAFVAAVAALAVLWGTACGRESKPQPPAKPSGEIPPPPALAQKGDSGMRQSGTQDLTRAPRREVDWSLATKDPLVTRLGRWDQVAKVDAACPSGDSSPRCADMRRRLKRVADESEVRVAIDQVLQAVPVFTRLWSDEFGKIGATFVAPSVNFYAEGFTVPDLSSVFKRTEITPVSCPLMWDNALYCPATHKIYLDAVYLARVAAAVRETDATSGRYATLTVAAHEIGHAVYAQAGDGGLEPYQEELLADCLAGTAMAAFGRGDVGTSQAARVLKGTGPLNEGQLGLYLMGGPEMVDGVHEAGPIRADFFTRGFNLGPRNCNETIKAIKPPR